MTDQPSSSPLMATPDDLMVWTSYLLRQAALRAQAEVGRALAALSLRPPHHSVMAMIAAEPRSQVALSAMLQTDRTTMVSIIDDLERLRLAERRVSPVDRRVHDVTLTEAGREALERSRSAIQAADERVLSALDPSERSQLRSLLGRLVVSCDERTTSRGQGHAG